MTLLIDGYNLLHASGIFGRGTGPGGFERSRLALLNFVADSLSAETLRRTTVVFDAAGAPPGLPHTLVHRGITVRFARRHASADELIEELIAADSAPKRLTVVSSDHRIQRAARRRKATAIDSDLWYGQTLRGRLRRTPASTETAFKPDQPLAENQVEFWLARLSDDELENEASGSEIFPPGYAEDIGEA